MSPHCYVNVKVPRLSALLFVSHLYRPVAEAVGTVGNSERFWRRVFQALWEAVGKSLLDFSTGFHRAAVSTAWAPVAWRSRLRLFSCLTVRETDCYSWHGTQTVTLH
jgi:hypothetical protein